MSCPFRLRPSAFRFQVAESALFQAVILSRCGWRFRPLPGRDDRQASKTRSAVRVRDRGPGRADRGAGQRSVSCASCCAATAEDILPGLPAMGLSEQLFGAPEEPPSREAAGGWQGQAVPRHGAPAQHRRARNSGAVFGFFDPEKTAISGCAASQSPYRSRARRWWGGRCRRRAPTTSRWASKGKPAAEPALPLVRPTGR